MQFIPVAIIYACIGAPHGDILSEDTVYCFSCCYRVSLNNNIITDTSSVSDSFYTTLVLKTYLCGQAQRVMGTMIVLGTSYNSYIVPVSVFKDQTWTSKSISLLGLILAFFS